MQRDKELQAWVMSLHPDTAFQIEFAAADAGFRQYFRITFADGSTRILMDAPPTQVDTHCYAKVCAMFSMIRVPTIYAHDVQRGFMELEDLGNVTYMTALQQQRDPAIAYRLLLEAIDTLIVLQQASRPGVLPDYDETLLNCEMQLFPEWLVAKEWRKPLTVPQRQVWDMMTKRILASILSQPRVFVHRDFIMRNLMITAGPPAVVDFQDAVYGPITYDLVSLLRDAFIEFEEEFIIDLVVRYWEKARRVGLPVAPAIDVFYRDFEWMGVQRHLKVAGIFCRLWHRDGKNTYLAEVPRFLDYLHNTTRRYTDLAPLYTLLAELSAPGIRSGYQVGI